MIKFEIDFPSVLELEAFIAAMNNSVNNHARYLEQAITPEFSDRIRRCHNFMGSVAFEADGLLKEHSR